MDFSPRILSSLTCIHLGDSPLFPALLHFIGRSGHLTSLTPGYSLASEIGMKSSFPGEYIYLLIEIPRCCFPCHANEGEKLVLRYWKSGITIEERQSCEDKNTWYLFKLTEICGVVRYHSIALLILTNIFRVLMSSLSKHNVIMTFIMIHTGIYGGMSILDPVYNVSNFSDSHVPSTIYLCIFMSLTWVGLPHDSSSPK